MRKEKDEEHNTTVHNTTQGKNRPGRQTRQVQNKNMPKKNNCQAKIATNTKNRTRCKKSSLFYIFLFMTHTKFKCIFNF